MVSDFGMPKDVSVQAIDANTKSSPLTMLQPIKPDEGGASYTAQNHEISLFTAQVIGSVIVTDSETRWFE